MPVRKAEAYWEGNLTKGKGAMKLGSGVFEGAFSFGSRFQDEPADEPRRAARRGPCGLFLDGLPAMLGRRWILRRTASTRRQR